MTTTIKTKYQRNLLAAALVGVVVFTTTIGRAQDPSTSLGTCLKVVEQVLQGACLLTGLACAISCLSGWLLVSHLPRRRQGIRASAFLPQLRSLMDTDGRDHGRPDLG